MRCCNDSSPNPSLHRPFSFRKRHSGQTAIFLREQRKASAQEVGLDLPAFAPCRSSGKYQAAVPQDVDEGTRAGITATPAFCINGRLVSGAQPLGSFVRVIDEELARARLGKGVRHLCMALKVSLGKYQLAEPYAGRSCESVPRTTAICGILLRKRQEMCHVRPASHQRPFRSHHF